MKFPLSFRVLFLNERHRKEIIYEIVFKQKYAAEHMSAGTNFLNP